MMSKWSSLTPHQVGNVNGKIHLDQWLTHEGKRLLSHGNLTVIANHNGRGKFKSWVGFEQGIVELSLPDGHTPTRESIPVIVIRNMDIPYSQHGAEILADAIIEILCRNLLKFSSVTSTCFAYKAKEELEISHLFACGFFSTSGYPAPGSWFILPIKDVIAALNEARRGTGAIGVMHERQTINPFLSVLGL